MRRTDKQAPDALAWSLLDRSPTVHLAGSLEDGTPVLRCLNHVVMDGALWFHGARVGEKLGLVGRPVVASVVEDLGRIPSYAQHTEKACPATTWYRSAQVRGVLAPEPDPEVRARALQALMVKLQPEGGHRPIRAGDPLYVRALSTLAVLRLRGEVSGKVALSQSKPASVRGRIVEALWRRGQPGDVDLIEAVVEDGRLQVPLLSGPESTRVRVARLDRDAAEVVRLVRQAWWSAERSDADILAAWRGADAWVGLEGPDGRLRATARAVSDGVRYAWVGDVVVDAPWRGRGLGRFLAERLLEHPSVRHVRRVSLDASDTHAFWGRLGFARAGGGASEPLERRRG